MELFVQVIGWIGTFLIILAYALVSTKKLEGNSTAYQVINLCGALGVGASVFYQKAWAALALEIVWAIIAIGILVQRRKHNTPR